MSALRPRAFFSVTPSLLRRARKDKGAPAATLLREKADIAALDRAEILSGDGDERAVAHHKGVGGELAHPAHVHHIGLVGVEKVLVFQEDGHRLLKGDADVQGGQRLTVFQVKIEDVVAVLHIEDLALVDRREPRLALKGKLGGAAGLPPGAKGVQQGKEGLPLHRFEQVLKGAHPIGLQRKVAGGGQVDQRRLPVGPADLLPQADAVHLRHQHVQEVEVVARAALDLAQQLGGGAVPAQLHLAAALPPVLREALFQRAQLLVVVVADGDLHPVTPLFSPAPIARVVAAIVPQAGHRHKCAR